MSTIIERLNEILNIKNNIKYAIRNKGVDIPDNTPFAQYPNRIANISGGGGAYDNLYNSMTNNGYNMTGLFAYCQGSALDLTGLDFSKVEAANNMFYNCKTRVILPEQCNTSNLRQAREMFSNFTNGGVYIDLSVFDFSNIQAANNMFFGCNLNNIDIRNINLSLSSLYQKNGMFDSCTGTLDLSNWSIDGITELQEFFRNCMCNKINLTNWITTNIMYMSNVFSYCTNLQELIIPDWDMTNTNNYWSMFNGCNKLNYVDIRNCNGDTVSKLLEQLPNKSEANFGEIELPEGISQDYIDIAMNKYWKPTSLEATPVTNGDISVGMNQIMIGEKTPITLSNCTPWYGNRDNIVFVSSNTDAVIIIDDKAKAVGEGEAQITAINGDTQAVISNNPVTIAVTLTDANPGLIMFKADNLNTDQQNWVMQVNNQEYTSNQLSYDGNVYSINVGAPITQFRMYRNSNITEVVKLNVSNMTRLNEIFYNCITLREIDANNWVTSSITEANSMFGQCTGLEIADISNWDTSGMKGCGCFNGCTSLHTVRMDNCSYDTINMIIGSGDFPRGTIDGVTRTIYCKQANAQGLEAPKGWVFSYVD